MNERMKSNVIVMTDAGKPVFFRYGSEGDIARQCGLVQAIRTSVNTKASILGLGEIQSIQTGNLCIVFMIAGSITLIHISERTKNVYETEAFARLQLEYIYAHLIFMLTTNIQTTLNFNPGFDLRSLISANENHFRGILDEINSDEGFGSFLASSIQTCYPISFKIRQKASRALQAISERIENNIAFALLLVGNKLLTVVQPSFRPHQLRVSDLHLILNFIEKQPGLKTSELWIPMCLPRFNSTGFLYAYTGCLDYQCALTLVILSPHNTTEQFQLLRRASQTLRENLSLPASSDPILFVQDDSVSIASSNSTSDLDWKRNKKSESFETSSTTDDGFVNISPEMLGSENSTSERGELLRQARQSAKLMSLDFICKQYLNDEDRNLLLHFMFRLDVPVDNSNPKRMYRRHQVGYLSQCICPIGKAPFNDDLFSQGLWTKYQNLSMRLRLGSASVEASADAFDMIRGDFSMTDLEKGDPSGFFPGIGKDCPAISFQESSPFNPDGISYIVEDEKMFLAMNGKHFELYLTSNGKDVKKVATIATKLVREMLRDEKVLFLSKPLTF